MNMHSSRRRRITRGFTLIEVLVSVLIFSFGILGAIGMQARLAQSTVRNGDRARASLLADELASQMWLKRTVNIPVNDPFYTAWVNRVATPTTSGLPGGVGSFSLDGTNTIATIKISWIPTNQPTARNSFQTSVVIP